MKDVLERIVKFLASFKLAVFILCALLVLTWLGTLEQRFRPIVDVQADYFESMIVVSRTLGATAEDPHGGFPIPLPGAYLLLALLFVNLIVGGVIRMRKNASTYGILITHAGIAILLLAGLVEFHDSDKGTMRILPNGTKSWFESFHDWDLSLMSYEEDGGAREWIIEQHDLPEPGESRTYIIKGLGVELVLDGYVRNADPRKAKSSEQGVDGAVLAVLKTRISDPENHMPGIRARMRSVEGGETKTLLLWGRSKVPARADVGGHTLSLDLRRHRWQLPFSLSLDRAEMSYYPGTGMAKEYSSYVQMTEAGASTDIHVTMNEPLRHRGYTFYQHEMHTLRTPIDGQKYATVFSVVRNPADSWPLWACVIIGIGLLMHFIQKLSRHVRAETRRQRNAESSAPAAQPA